MFEGVFVSAIVPAAGSGSRMGGERSKTWLQLDDKMMIEWTLLALMASRTADEIVVVGQVAEQAEFEGVFKRVSHWWCEAAPGETCPVFKFAPGGKERLDSVSNGLLACDTAAGLIMVHDGARPLVSVDVIQGALTAAKASGAAIACVPAKDTIKVASPEGFVMETPDRSQLYQVQTPQCFEKSLLSRAYAHAAEKQLKATDDSGLVEALGHPVKITAGSYVNIKVTTPEDQVVALAMLRQRDRR